MTRVDNYINMLKEFDYKKNGKDATVQFLIELVQLLDETYEYEWESDKNETR